MNLMKIMEETLKCFKCRIDKPLSKYAPNRRKYQIKSHKGMCFICKQCKLLDAIRSLKVVRFDFEANTFNVIYFKDANEAVAFIDAEEGEY